MSTLTYPQTRRRAAQRVAITAGLLGATVALSVAALFGAAANPPCTTPTTAAGTGGGAGTFAAPLQLQVGRAYAVGATEYGGPNDPSSGTVGSSGTDLPDHPDSFAELSLLDVNPARDGGGFTFQDADALGALPYGTPVRVTHNGHALTLVKEDIGYGQGPGQPIPYRLDVWWQAATQLQITKSTVEIQRLPATGSGALLNQLPAGTQATPAADAACATGSGGSGSTPTPVTSGQVAQINPLTGVASAPAAAPSAVKRVIAAANQIIDTPYMWGGGHEDLDQLAAGYDCSASAEYALHQAGLFTPTSGPSSTAFEHYYPAGAGQWITVYANPQHMWLVVAGIVLDTAWYSPVTPTTPESGPRWQPATVIQQQIAGNAAAGYPPFSVTHPEGL
jgi:hypothetical protein